MRSTGHEFDMLYLHALAVFCQRMLKWGKGKSSNKILILQQAQRNKVQINRDKPGTQEVEINKLTLTGLSHIIPTILYSEHIFIDHSTAEISLNVSVSQLLNF